jgi:hypothetical protein
MTQYRENTPTRSQTTLGKEPDLHNPTDQSFMKPNPIASPPLQSGFGVRAEAAGLGRVPPHGALSVKRRGRFYSDSWLLTPDSFLLF